MKRILAGTLVLALSALAGCAATGTARIPVDSASAQPGATVTLRGQPVVLAGTPIRVGERLPATALIDAMTMKKTDLSSMTGSVLIVSLVPSLDTKVCEEQTHALGEQDAGLPATVTRVTVSRDTPFAQKRFAGEAKLTGITYLSDYRDGSFGRATGLLQEESMLLARAVIVVDKEGIVRYLQVVPELSHLPDMETAFARARELAGR
jgi:thiol peroxidase